MKKILFILPIIFFNTCDPLDVEPLDSIAAEDAITTVTGLESALNGVYNELQSASISEDVMVFGDLAADNLVHIGTKKEYREISDHIVTTQNAYIEGIWNNSYDAINQVNNILDAIDGVVGASASEIDGFKAQAMFLRAFNYFNLLKLFGGVPLKTLPTRGISNEELFIERSTVEEVFSQIISDLTEAADLLDGTGKKSAVYADEGAVNALLARVYLERGEDANAFQAANKVINMGYSLVDGASYAGLYDEESSNDEIIWMIDFANDDETNGLADWFLPDARFEVASWETIERTGSLADYFDDADLRKEATIQTTERRGFVDYYGAKYQDFTNNSDNVIVFRLAEMYLIAAEAENNLGYVADGNAFSNLNAIRQRAGLDPVDSSDLPDQSSFIEELLLQRRLELAFEGHRYFDLKRFGQLNTLPFAGELVDEHDGLFPIPQSEMDTNEAMEQNLNY